METLFVSVAMRITMNTTTSRSITYDIPAIIALQEDYQETIQYIEAVMPDVNWNSQLETRQFFLDEHNLLLQGHTIQYLKDTLANIDTEEYIDDPETCKEMLSGLIELKKLKSIIRNYTGNILRHHKDGVYPLRLVNGEWMMQNKQPLSYCHEINECIIAQTQGE